MYSVMVCVCVTSELQQSPVGAKGKIKHISNTIINSKQWRRRPTANNSSANYCAKQTRTVLCMYVCIVMSAARIYICIYIVYNIYISIYNCSARAAAAEHRNHTVQKLSQLIVYTHKHIVTYIHIHIYI